MRKLTMKEKRRKSDNNSDIESEENGGSTSTNNAGNSVDTTEEETMSKTKRRSSKIKNANAADESSSTAGQDATENENGHAEKGSARKRRKKEDQKPTTSQEEEDDEQEQEQEQEQELEKKEENNEQEDQEYEVEKIVDHRTIKGRRQFLVRWKGYGEDDDTWEQEKDLNCPQLIEQFLSGLKVKEESNVSPKTSKKSEKKGKRPKSKSANAKEKTENADEGGEYEVDRIIDVYFKKNGKREFLIRWKGFKPSEDSWEPEENLNCSDLIKRFMSKVEEAKAATPRSLRTNPVPTKRYTLATKDSGRRLSRRNRDKQRATYHQCEL